MESGFLTSMEKQNMVSSFQEIAVGQSADTARQFLQATSWKLEEAIQLFFVGNDGGLASSSYSSPIENIPLMTNETLEGRRMEADDINARHVDTSGVRPPLPVIREALYDDAMIYRSSETGYPLNEMSSLVGFRTFDEEIGPAEVWEADQSAASTTNTPRDNLASIYRPPFAMMYHGPFDTAKFVASDQDKWLLVNLQSIKEFSSHMLNRDTWANDAVAQTISANFIFWQVYDDTSEGRKVCTYYRLDSIPIILVIDPITGQKMREWPGMVQPINLLEDLSPFLDNGPKDHHATLSQKRPREHFQVPSQKVQAAEETKKVSTESMEVQVDPTPTKKDEPKTTEEEEICSRKKPSYPPLPEEPKGDRNFLCRVGVRLPDGRRLQRNFLRSDPLQFLWSFCYIQLGESEMRPFRLTQAIPGASKSLNYETNLTFGESDLSNSMISVAWE